jgi:uncharacterized protein YegL
MNGTASEEETFEQVEFAENPEPRCACALLADDSISMAEGDGQKIIQLNEGRIALRDDLRTDELAIKRVEIAQIAFGPVRIAQPFCPPDQLDVTPWQAQGDCTPLGAVTLTGLQMVRERVALYKKLGVPYYRPWVILVTDGKSTDKVDEAAEQVRLMEEAHQVAFFAVGVDRAHMPTLKRLSVREPLRLRSHRFKEMFLWLSASMKSTSRSSVDEKVDLPTPHGWAQV